MTVDDRLAVEGGVGHGRAGAVVFVDDVGHDDVFRHHARVDRRDGAGLGRGFGVDRRFRFRVDIVDLVGSVRVVDVVVVSVVVGVDIGIVDDQRLVADRGDGRGLGFEVAVRSSSVPPSVAGNGRRFHVVDLVIVIVVIVVFVVVGERGRVFDVIVVFEVVVDRHPSSASSA